MNVTAGTVTVDKVIAGGTDVVAVLLDIQEKVAPKPAKMMAVPNDFTEIIPGLWMGGSYLPTMPTGFDAVVCCREVTDWALIGVPFLHLPMIDGPKVPPSWLVDYGVHVLDTSIYNGQKTLVHCAEGHNRSGLIVGAYLVLACIGGTMSPQSAIDLIRSKRPGALSNQTFVDYLMSL